MPPQPQDGHLQVGELRLHYLRWGDASAPPMVLLHGLQDCAHSWDVFASAMCQDYNVVALDHRGHGDSEWADQYRLDDYVEDVKAMVEALSLRDFVLVGHSAGGRNAFLYTVRHPQTVKALVIVDIDPDAANPESASMFRRYHAESDEWGSLDAVIERLRSRQPNSTDETLAHQSRHMTRESPGGKRVWKRDRRLVDAYERPDLWAEWSRIECPTLIARGRQSNLLTPRSRRQDAGGHTPRPPRRARGRRPLVLPGAPRPLRGNDALVFGVGQLGDTHLSARGHSGPECPGNRRKWDVGPQSRLCALFHCRLTLLPMLSILASDTGRLNSTAFR